MSYGITAQGIGRGGVTWAGPGPARPNGVGAGLGRRAADIPVTPPAGSPPPGALRARIVGIALAELARWDGGRRRETDPAMTPVLQEYFRTGVGIQVGASDLRSASWHAKNAWSAAFVSYVMRRAGAVGFRFSAAHREYVAAAKRNALRGDTGNPFWAFPIGRARPAPGDLVCADRATAGRCNSATFGNIDDGRRWATHCDIVTNVDDFRRQITVVGGNVGNSVKAKTLRIDADGFLVPGQGDCGHFAVVKTLDAGSPPWARPLLPDTRGAPTAGELDGGSSVRATGMTGEVPAHYRIEPVSLDRTSPHYFDRPNEGVVPSPPRALVFPNGVQVWRAAPGGPILHAAPLALAVGSRAGLERRHYTATQHGLLPQFYQRAHALGQGTGFESPFAIYYAPEFVNQTLQNKGIEEFMRRLAAYQVQVPGQSLRVLVQTSPHSGTRRLREINYRIRSAVGGLVHDVAGYTIHIGGTRDKPLVTADPIRFAGNPVARAIRANVEVPSVIIRVQSRQY
jgi:hypothetical protein